MKNLKVGDKVWTIQDGETIVIEIKEDYDFPIITANDKYYTLDGLHYTSDKHPSLFLSNPFKKFEPRFMMVSDNGKNWVKRYVVAEGKMGFMVKFPREETYVSYECAKEIETTTLTRAEIAEKFNVDLENLIIE